MVLCVTGIELDMESCLASCVQRYLQLCESSRARSGTNSSGKTSRKSAKAKKKASMTEGCEIDPSRYLTVVMTPFLNDSDQKDSPQGSPCDDPNHPDAVTCPWCSHRFVKGKPDPPRVNKKKAKPETGDEAGGGGLTTPP